MKRTFVLLVFTLTILGCGEGRVDLITSDVISDVASCYENVEVAEDSYLVALDKTCVDLEMASLGGIAPGVPSEPILRERDWELLATLERDVRQKHWHEFHVQEGTDEPILQAYVNGKDFLFVIEHPGVNSIRPIQFYFAQPDPPSIVRVNRGFNRFITHQNRDGIPIGAVKRQYSEFR